MTDYKYLEHRLAILESAISDYLQHKQDTRFNLNIIAKKAIESVIDWFDWDSVDEPKPKIQYRNINGDDTIWTSFKTDDGQTIQISTDDKSNKIIVSTSGNGKWIKPDSKYVLKTDNLKEATENLIDTIGSLMD